MPTLVDGTYDQFLIIQILAIRLHLLMGQTNKLTFRTQ